jgi:hypothetical protein
VAPKRDAPPWVASEPISMTDWGVSTRAPGDVGNGKRGWLTPQPGSKKHFPNSELMCYVNFNLAREAGWLAEWKEKFWGRRYRAIVVSNEEEAQVERLTDFLSNGIKENLVEHLKDWLGARGRLAPF